MTCSFSDQDSLQLNRFIGGFIHAGDEIDFDPTAPLPLKEWRVVQQQLHRRKELYFCAIGYVAQPKTDKRGEYFLRAEVSSIRIAAYSETDSRS